VSLKPARNRAARPEARLTPEDESRIEQLLKQRLIGVSRWVKRARGFVAVHAVQANPLLLEGEPGAGKEFIARLIHECSPRRRGPFLTLACEAVAEEALAARLFGSIKALRAGRFYTRRGLVEKAAGGTLYLEGATTLSPAFQAQITRLILHQEFCRAGDKLVETADVRMLLGDIVPPPKDSSRESAPKEISFPISDRLTIPALRRRKADIETLSRHFPAEFCRRQKKEPRELSRGAVNVLRRYSWPGNIGELKRVMEQAAQQAKPPQIETARLPIHIARPSGFHGDVLNLRAELKQFERTMLCAALKQSRGVQSAAAQLLGLKLTTLHTKLKTHEIDVESFKEASS
jgi:DNA-binding NtrC family response regulator